MSLLILLEVDTGVSNGVTLVDRSCEYEFILKDDIDGDSVEVNGYGVLPMNGFCVNSGEGASNPDPSVRGGIAAKLGGWLNPPNPSGNASDDADKGGVIMFIGKLGSNGTNGPYGCGDCDRMAMPSLPPLLYRTGRLICAAYLRSLGDASSDCAKPYVRFKLSIVQPGVE